MLQQCSHPNVVRYLGSYQGEEYLWVVLVIFNFVKEFQATLSCIDVYSFFKLLLLIFVCNY